MPEAVGPAIICIVGRGRSASFFIFIRKVESALNVRKFCVTVFYVVGVNREDAAVFRFDLMDFAAEITIFLLNQKRAVKKQFAAGAATHTVAFSYNFV